MNKHLQNLIKLSKVDNEIASFDQKEQEIKSDLTKLELQKHDIDAQVQSINNAIKDDKVKQNRNDIYLQEESEKLNQIAKKQKNIKTERELKALSIEENIAREQINFANTEIERLEKSIETKQENLASLQEELQEIEKLIQEKSTSVNQALEDFELEKKSAYKAKDDIVADMDQKIITFYEKIKRWAGNTTVVEVKKQACYGCFMKINDKTYAEVIKATEIVSCPHCGRILYNNEEENIEDSK